MVLSSRLFRSSGIVARRSRIGRVLAFSLAAFCCVNLLSGATNPGILRHFGRFVLN